MSTDLIEALSTMRPTPKLSVDESLAMLDGILTGAVVNPPAHPSRSAHRSRRLAIGAAVTGIAASVAVLGQALLPSSAPGGAQPAAAAELHRLARIAGSRQPLAPGQFLYTKGVSTQTGIFSDAAHTQPPVTATTHTQEWVDSVGDTWSERDVVHLPAGQSDRDVSYEPGANGIGDLKVLPTDAKALNVYLRSHASGSSSVDEAVFQAIEPILYSGIASSALRSAALDVLAGDPHVTVTREAVDTLGRRVERFDFIDQVNRPNEVQSISFDPTSGLVLEEKDTQPGSTNVGTTESYTVTDAVPADIVAAGEAELKEVQQHGGEGG